ncbi:MAG: hypothetical protein ABI231_01085 [Candidatus Tumulicola sp.]
MPSPGICANISGHSRAVAFALQHLGAVAALRVPIAAEGSTEIRSHAARLLGFSDARIAAMGSGRQPADQRVYDRALAALHDAMGADTVASLMAEGAVMTEEQAVDEALAL